jgi:uncharacterized protein (DUF1697 family)
MALIVFLRGVNVGGHRIFRPSVLAKELGAYDVVNVGAAGTFVARKPGSRTRFLADLRRKLPFETNIAVCDDKDLLQLEMENPFGPESPSRDAVLFLSILTKDNDRMPALPIAIPRSGEPFVRIIGSKGRFLFGVYRRHMKAITCLGQIDKYVGAPVTTRNWNTILAVLRILKAASK